MIFGKIEYLNLLPFHIFMKRFLPHLGMKQSMEYHKSVPAKINEKFLHRRVDAAYISSIASKKHCNNPRLGIIAHKEVRSVLVIPSKTKQSDSESATSNALAELLGIEGKVLIGDKALRYALKHDDYIDLASLWYEKEKLPFVFATLCSHVNSPLFSKLQRRFLHQARSIKIPHYILHKVAQKTKIPPKEITAYLQLISYSIDTKSHKSLKKFLKKAKSKKRYSTIEV